MLSNEKLNKLYHESEEVDKSLFSEQRSNLLMIAGEHYNNKRRRQYVNRIRNTTSMSDDQKLRLTKNHIAKIHALHANNITSTTPGVMLLPANEKELQDNKTAELNNKVWDYGKRKMHFREKVRRFAEDFTGIGEVACKMYFDPYKGKVIGYESKLVPLPVPLIDEMSGEMITEAELTDEMGNPVPDHTKPVFEGDICIERIFGFNLLRPQEAKCMDDARFLIIRKMVNVQDLRDKYKDNEEKLKVIEETKDDTFLVFDGQSAKYTKSKHEVMVLEFYFKPCMEYPEGYFYIKTEAGILEEGVLPYGIYPIKYKGFMEVQTSPRSHSILKHLRPYQVEINRAASAIATHQITLGDDKLVGNTMGKVEQGGVLPGVRFIKVNAGGDLKVLPGRSGEQYLPYLQNQIAEMYDVAMLREEAIDAEVTADMMVNLFRSMKQKKKFSVYIEKFEEFLGDICETYLELARVYMSDEELINAFGKDEAVNLAEFRHSDPQRYRVKVEPQTDDIDTVMGKQIMLNHTLQYVGANLDNQQIGKILKAMPFANGDKAFDDFTIDEENAENIMLAIERGEQPILNRYDNHKYIISKLTHRMRQADFQLLHPEIQMLYQATLQQHEQLEAQIQLEIQRAQAGFIPTGGYTVKADFYVTTEDGKTKRAEFPYEALAWLQQQLTAQGMTQEALQQMNEGALADLAQMVTQGGMVPPGTA